MTEFPNVSTGAARYQQLSINPQKISGQCGRLKCCLNFELDGYTEALKEFPKSSKKIVTKEGEAKFVKLDVFKKVMYYFNVNNPTSELLEMPVVSVKKILELDKKGEIPENFDFFIKNQTQSEVSFEDAMGQDNINRFDKKQKKNKKRSERRANFKKNKMKASAKRKS